MTFKLKEKCDNSKKKEIFYGAMINRDIKDVYLGLCSLEPGEIDRKAGPPKGHEEILYLLEGQIKVIYKDGKEVIMKDGDAYFLPNGNTVMLENLTDKKIYLIVAGGHPKPHKHHH